MSVHIYLDNNDELYVLWDGQLGIYQHIKQNGQNEEVFQPPAPLELIWPLPPSQDDYERGYENGYDNGYDAGSEEAYEAGLEAGRDW